MSTFFTACKNGNAMIENTADPLISPTRLRALRSAVGSTEKPLILAIHDYPDPDAIAAALAIQTLTGSWGVNAIIAHGGVIGRAENHEMVALLKIDLKSFESLPNPAANYRGAILLDTQPLARNQSLPDCLPILAVIDHHILPDDSTRIVGPAPGTGRILYSDIRPDVGSSSTLALGYLEAAGITPDSRLATALFLGIKTDTDGLLRGASAADVQAYTKLLPLADLVIAAKSIHPPLERDYFRFLHQAVGKAAIFGKSIFAFCGDVAAPDMLSTASDTLIPIRGVDYALAAGVHKGRVYLSLRAKPGRSDATRILLHITAQNGRGGGHNLSAGGSVDIGPGQDAEECVAAVRGRFLEATGDIGCTREDLIQ